VTAVNGTTGGVVDVKSAFLTTNASYHPVLGKQNNSYVGNARMKAPWNTLSPAKAPGTLTGWGFLITCWDCHAPQNTTTGTLTRTVTAHGGGAAATVTLRQQYWAQNTVNLCTVCHDVSVGTSTHGAGSAWQTVGHSTPGARARDACYTCHGSATAKPVRPIAAQDVHGFDSFAPAMGTDKLWPYGTGETYRPYGFMRNVGTSGQWRTTAYNWKPLSGPGVPTGTATCGAPDGNTTFSLSCGNEAHSNYTPGGVY